MHNNKLSIIDIITVLFLLLIAPQQSSSESPIAPYTDNLFYWEYNDKPILLIGATNHHDMFNRPTGIYEELYQLHSIGGNYIRNVMSHRHPGNEYPYIIPEGENKFDLTLFNDTYWNRFEKMLEWTKDLDIIVQIEIWASRDFYSTNDSYGGWSRHPFNPDNNVNYTRESSSLPGSDAYDLTPSRLETPTPHKFFNTVPALDNNEIVLAYQKAFVDKILSHTLEYNHVLYCMNNETTAAAEWGQYWIQYIKEKALKAGKKVYATDMFEDQDILGNQHHPLYEHPEMYDFIEISQNNHQTGQLHWDRFQARMIQMSDNPRPFTNVKIYGGTRPRPGLRVRIVRFLRNIGDREQDNEMNRREFKGGPDEGVAKFFRNIFGGSSAQRFHRPYWGIGLDEMAQASIRSASMFISEFTIFNAHPRNDLLLNRESDAAYISASLDFDEFAIYFPRQDSVEINLTDFAGEYSVRWLEIRASEWHLGKDVTGGQHISLTTPANGHWIVILRQVSPE
jgi:hypothetical protein